MFDELLFGFLKMGSVSIVFPVKFHSLQRAVIGSSRCCSGITELSRKLEYVTVLHARQQTVLNIFSLEITRSFWKSIRYVRETVLCPVFQNVNPEGGFRKGGKAERRKGEKVECRKGCFSPFSFLSSVITCYPLLFATVCLVSSLFRHILVNCNRAFEDVLKPIK